MKVALVAALSLVARATAADVITVEESQQRATQDTAEKECAGKAAQAPCAIGKSKGTCVAATCSRPYYEEKEGHPVRQTKVEPCTQCNATPGKPGEERASRCSASVVGSGVASPGWAMGFASMVAIVVRRRRRGGA